MRVTALSSALSATFATPSPDTVAHFVPVSELPELALSWIQQGAKYGYPICCVANFVEVGREFPTRQHDFEASHPHLRAQGFVPCPACQQRPVNDIIKEINRERTHPEPFPAFHEADVSTAAEAAYGPPE